MQLYVLFRLFIFIFYKSLVLPASVQFGIPKFICLIFEGVRLYSFDQYVLTLASIVQTDQG